MQNWSEVFQQAMRDADDFDNETIKALKALLPTGNVFRPRRVGRGWEKPTGCGVYAIWNSDETVPMYIGSTNSFWKRIPAHITKRLYRPRENFIALYQCDNVERAQRIEAILITLLRPPGNRHLPFRRVITGRLAEFAISVGLTVSESIDQ